jgi:hypothetical protein
MRVEPKDVAYMQISKEYRGGLSHALLTLIGGRSANTVSHALWVEWWIDSYTAYEDIEASQGILAEHYVMDRRHVMCGAEPPHELSGRALDEAMEGVKDVVKSLQSIGYYITVPGPYWYSIKLERDWGTYDEDRYGPMGNWPDVDKVAG